MARICETSEMGKRVNNEGKRVNNEGNDGKTVQQSVDTQHDEETDEFANNYFRKLDTEGKGYVPLSDLERALKSWDFCTSCYTNPDTANTDDDGRRSDGGGGNPKLKAGKKAGKTGKTTSCKADRLISYEAFRCCFRNRVRHLENVFHQVDIDQHGFLTQDQVKECLQKLNICTANQKKLQSWIDSIDPGHSNRISFRSFRDMFFQLPLNDPAAFLESMVNYPSLTLLGMERDKVETESRAETCVKLLDGAIAGIISRTATAPLDRVRLLMQAGTVTHAHLSLFETVTWIGRTGGWRSYWQGNGGNCIKIAPDQAIMYLSFDWAQSYICLDRQNPTLSERFLCGGLAGTFTSFCVYPLCMARTLLAVKPPEAYRGTFDCLRKTYTAGGVRGMFTGVSTAMIGNLPFCGLQLGLAELLKDYVKRRYDDRGCPGMPVLLACGMASSILALTTTYPIWVLRVKMQTQGYNGVPHYDNLRDCVRKTARGGWKPFYRGLVPSAVKVVPATGLSYAVYTKLDALRHDFFHPERNLPRSHLF
eukprot:gb/GEZN01005895.1/.p1 GENE.gb/GEZN01005895.1/~~gb/GEZN01005895.1/.p1  ORF type:complete len:535 (-),score=37.33 gb/GEZN01005895.1/:56-1660(-)